MASTRRKLQAAALFLGAVLIVACEEIDNSSGADHESGFNDDEVLGTCTLEFTNDTGYVLDQAQFFPTDIFGIMKELPDLPIEQGDTRTMELQFGVYQMMVNNTENDYLFISTDHACLKDQLLEVTATIEDLKIGMLHVINDSGFTVISVSVASTDDLIFGDNALDGVLEDGKETYIATGEGRFYWLLEDSEGGVYFGNDYIHDSIDGWAPAHADTKIDSDELCTLTLTNATGISIEYICIMEEGIGGLFPAAEVFDSRGNLPDSESLDILMAPGTWKLLATGSYGYGGQFELSGLVCIDGQPLAETLTPDDNQ